MPCLPPEDASGDGELDLSGIDDLEIDRVSAVLCMPPEAAGPAAGLCPSLEALGLLLALSPCGLCGRGPHSTPLALGRSTI